jgi:prepilin-type N-terminal cleavage/methylation domain-containing protein
MAKRSVMSRARPSRNGFTLIELLVVISIIGLLIAILVPSLSKARRSAKRTACGANLHQLGIAMRGYLNDSKDVVPYASYLPSFPLPPLPPGAPPFMGEPNQPIYLADVMAPYLNGGFEVLHCPGDRPGDPQREAPYQNQSYFDTERSSYELNRRIRGRNITEFRNQLQQILQQHGRLTAIAESNIWLLKDYGPFHGKQGQDGTFRYLYVDGHVTGFEGF